MKKILTLILILGTNIACAQVKNGDIVPDLKFSTVLNAPVKSISLSQLKGKIVVLEFWATWCGSCLVAMPHLQALQAKYPNNLQVIAVTDEAVKRTGLYLSTKPADFWFAVDTARTISGIFPHQLIPHTILISPDGKLIGATSPESITNAVIDSLLNKQHVHLPEKKDNLVSYQDLIKQNFLAADTTSYRFTMQGEIKGGPGLSTTWLDNPAFSGHRLTCINLPLTTLYMLAYGNYPYSRMVDQTKSKEKAPVYCIDLIVKTHNELLPSLQKELAKRFDLQARVEQRRRYVHVLRVVDPLKFQAVQRNQSHKRTYYARHGEIDQEAITMAEFAQFLEDYGVNKLVVDETGNNEKFNIKFSFQPENPQSLLDILAGMGLSLTNQQKEIDMLVLYKNTNLQ